MDGLAIGVPIRWADAGPADFTIVWAMMGAVFILRFYIGAALTMMSTAVALFAAALWASSIEVWGVTIPSTIALVLISHIRANVRRSRSD